MSLATLQLASLGLTADGIRALTGRAQPLSRDETRRAMARAWRKLSHGGRAMPDYVVWAMRADYERTNSLRAVAKMYGRVQSTIVAIFRQHGVPLRRRGGANHTKQGLNPMNANLTTATLPAALNEREYTVWRSVCAGKTAKDIARDLGMSRRSIVASRKSLCEKLGVKLRDTAALVRVAASTELLKDLPPLKVVPPEPPTRARLGMTKWDSRPAPTTTSP